MCVFKFKKNGEGMDDIGIGLTSYMGRRSQYLIQLLKKEVQKYKNLDFEIGLVLCSPNSKKAAKSNGQLRKSVFSDCLSLFPQIKITFREDF